jgi:hypothetical protein
MFFRIPDDGQSLETIIVSVTRHCQNPLESTKKCDHCSLRESGKLCFYAIFSACLALFLNSFSYPEGIRGHKYIIVAYFSDLVALPMMTVEA